MTAEGRAGVVAFVGQALFGMGLMLIVLTGLCSMISAAFNNPIDWVPTTAAGGLMSAVGAAVWRLGARRLREARQRERAE
jgi:hypothetical protein